MILPKAFQTSPVDSSRFLTLPQQSPLVCVHKKAYVSHHQQQEEQVPL